MSGVAFFDTNILVYADDFSAGAKQVRAIALVDEHYQLGTAVFSVQVLQEYYSIATGKLRLPGEQAQRRVELLARSRVVRTEPSDVLAAIEYHRLHQISFWDALIVHSARSSGASVLYSEDFQSGSFMGGVRVVNPFLPGK